MDKAQGVIIEIIRDVICTKRRMGATKSIKQRVGFQRGSSMTGGLCTRILQERGLQRCTASQHFVRGTMDSSAFTTGLRALSGALQGKSVEDGDLPMITSCFHAKEHQPRLEHSPVFDMFFFGARKAERGSITRPYRHKQSHTSSIVQSSATANPPHGVARLFSEDY
jgi:hypothetical protein